MLNERTTQELFTELTSKLIIKLEDNEILCPTCKGLRFTYRQQGENGYISNCTDCYNGKVYKCKYCGKTNKTDRCECKEAYKERNDIFNAKEQAKEKELFEKAKKVKFADYEGKFLLSGSDFVECSDSVYEWLYDKVIDEGITYEDLPKYLWSTKAESVFSLDIDDIIQNECESGYEDMYSCLDTNDENLTKAQEYLNKWCENQGDSLNIYYEDYSIAVLLDDLIEELKRDIEKEFNI